MFWFDDQDRDEVLKKVMWAGIVLFLLVGLIACLEAVTAMPQEDPHANQPDHCTNAKDAPAAHKCDCHKAEPEDGGLGCDVEDVKCKVYCRKDHCHCFHPKCDS